MVLSIKPLVVVFALKTLVGVDQTAAVVPTIQPLATTEEFHLLIALAAIALCLIGMGNFATIVTGQVTVKTVATCRFLTAKLANVAVDGPPHLNVQFVDMLPAFV